MSELTNSCPRCGAPAGSFPVETTAHRCAFCSVEFAVRHPDYEAHERELERQREEREEREEQEREEREEQEREAREEREEQERAQRSKQAKETEAKSDRKVAAFSTVFVLAFLGASAGGGYYYEEVYRPSHWDGHHSWRCSKGTFTLTDVQATERLEASGTCQVTLVRPSFETYLRASDHAVVRVVGGRLHASSGVVQASGFARVTLEGTTVESGPTSTAIEARGAAVVESKAAVVRGRLRADDPSELVGFAAPAPTASAPPATTPHSPPNWSYFACAGIINCYQGAAKGTYSGKVETQIDASGNNARSSVKAVAPPAVTTCLASLARAKSLTGMAADERPGAGNLVCDYTFDMRGPVPIVSQRGNYVLAAK